LQRKAHSRSKDSSQTRNDTVGEDLSEKPDPERVKCFNKGDFLPASG
jgi:hypothetical protein